MQCQVICPKLDFSKVELYKNVVDERKKVIPDDEEEEDLEDPESMLTNLPADS